jgi:hypothetical protein
MTVILMTQEMGSRGDEVAAGIAECLDVELVHREGLERCVAERIQIDEATVQRIFKGNASVLERWMIDKRRLARCMREEVVRLAVRGDVLVQTWRTVPVLRLIKHVICVHVCATSLPKTGASVDRATERNEIWQSNTKREWVQRLIPHRCESLEHYDLVINSERIPVNQCVEQVRWLAQSPQFQPTTGSRALLANLIQQTQQRSAPSSPPTEPRLIAHEVIINSSRVKLGGATSNEQAIARIEGHLHGEKPPIARGCSLPPAGIFG